MSKETGQGWRAITYSVKVSKGIIALHIGNVIYVHPNLSRYPELFRYAINHELQHLHNHGDSVKDFMIDIKPNKKFIYFVRFMLDNPDAFKHLLPFNKIDGRWYYCLYDIIFYITILICGGLIYYGIR